MVCSPARIVTAKNGKPCQISATMMAASAVSGRASHATGASMMPDADQNIVQDADIEVVHPCPHQPDDDAGQRPGHDDQARASAAPPEALVEQQRGDEARAETAARPRPTIQMAECQSEIQNTSSCRMALEIPQADEGGGIGFVEQVILQAEPDRLGHRHDDDRSRDRQRGRQKPGRCPAGENR